MKSVAVQTIAIDLFVGSTIPLILVAIMTRFFHDSRSWRLGLAAWPFALIAGLAFTLAALAVAVLLGPEFPSVLGALIGLAVMVPLARRRALFGPATCAPMTAPGDGHEPAPTMPLLRAWAPYGVLLALLILTRIDALPFKALLQSVTLSWTDIFGTGISTSIAPLYLPGGLFIVTAIGAAFFFRMPQKKLSGAAGAALGVIARSMIALVTAVAMVRIFIQSGVNEAGLRSMPLELAAVASDATGPAWPLFAPFVGALGAFLSGSATFSNMMFALLQFSAADHAGLPHQTVLAAQMLGANAGNMISILNVVAAAAVVGLLREEGRIIRFTMWPMLYYCLWAGMITLILILITGGT